MSEMKPAFLALLVAAAAVPVAAAQAREPLRVGEVEAAAGQQASGYLLVPDGVDPGTKIPVSEGEPLGFVGHVVEGDPKP